MMNFNFGEVANASQSTSKPVLEGNMIHTVKFLGCEARDIAGVKDPTKTYNLHTLYGNLNLMIFKIVKTMELKILLM